VNRKKAKTTSGGRERRRRKDLDAASQTRTAAECKKNIRGRGIDRRGNEKSALLGGEKAKGRILMHVATSCLGA